MLIFAVVGLLAMATAHAAPHLNGTALPPSRDAIESWNRMFWRYDPSISRETIARYRFTLIVAFLFSFAIYFHIATLLIQRFYGS